MDIGRMEIGQARGPLEVDALGGRLRAARHDAGLSQSQLAARSGIPKPRLSRYENGHILPSVPTLARLADAVGVPPDALLSTPRTPLEAFVQGLRKQGVEFRSVDEAEAAAQELARRFGCNGSA